METLEQLPLILNPGRISISITVILMCAAFIGYFVYRINRDGNPSEIAEVRTLNERLNNKYDELFRQHDKLQTEFESYKKNALAKYDSLNSIYESEKPLKKELSRLLWHSRREVRKLKQDLIDAARQISELGEKYSKAERDRADNEAMYASALSDYAQIKVKYDKLIAAPEIKPDKIEEKTVNDFSWANWIATDYDGYIYAYALKPLKMEIEFQWLPAINDNKAKVISQDKAQALCGFVPSWTDEEPTPAKR